MDYKILITMGLIGFSNFSHGDPITLIEESVKVYQYYREFQGISNPQNTESQNAAINSSPVMLNLNEQRTRAIRLKRIVECHRDYDTIIMGKTFTSTKCKQLEDNFYEPIGYKAGEK